MQVAFFTRILQVPLFLFWLLIWPFTLLYRPTTLADFIPATLVALSITFSVAYHYKSGIPRWFDSLAYAATIAVALLIPFFLHLPNPFTEYHPLHPTAMWDYGPADELNPLLAVVVKGLATVMCGGGNHLWHRDVEAYSCAYAGWAFTSSIAWSIALWKRLGIAGRYGLAMTLSVVWILMAVTY